MTASPPQFSGPWLPWYHGDFLRATQGWTVAERGIYFLLLGASWEIGPLPDDRRRLAGIVGAQLEEFDEAWKLVRPKFELTAKGLLNPRLEFHREKQAIRSEKARQSVMNRWNATNADTNVDTIVETNVNTNAGESYARIDANSMLGDTNHSPSRDHKKQSNSCNGVQVNEFDTNVSSNVSTNESKTYAKSDTNSIRSGYSSELRTQNSEKDKNSKAARTNARAAMPAFHQQVIESYHELCPGLPHVKIWTQKRRQSLDSRIAERTAAGKPADSVDYWRSLFQQVASSDFLCGRTKEPFTASLEWLLLPNNFAKTIEGHYSNRKPNGAASHG